MRKRDTLFSTLNISKIDFSDKEKAIHLIYKECYPSIRKYILNNKGSVDDAKDVFQEAMIIFMNKLAQYQEANVNVKALIITIAKNKWTDIVRRNQKNVGFDNVYSEEIHETQTADFSLIDEERNSQIRKIFDAVGDRCKELLSNIIFYDMSMRDIVEKMGFSNESSAKTQHYKCKQKLIENFSHNTQLREYLKSFR